MNWIISANSKMYDHATAFQRWGFIDWRQVAKYHVGDIVYIYCTRPITRIMYKTEVIIKDMAFEDITDDKEYWQDISEYDNSKGKKFARLKLLEQVDTEELSLSELQKNGLKSAPQGPIKVTVELEQYINKHFNDFYAKGFFNDVEHHNIFEGHVRSVFVNKYERSSVARKKCIEYNGVTCKVCGVNFEDMYGDLGKDFIHIHHIIPLHTIGKDYIVNYKEDLVPVCPNCHAMLHRRKNGEYLSLEELKSIIKK